MGSSSSSTDLKNDINNFISQQQRALANVVTQSVVNVSHTIIQELSASIISNASASNILNGYQIIVKNGAKFSINQQNYLKSNAEAILNLIQDNSAVVNLSNSIKNDVMSTLAQNADVANKLSAAASLLHDQQTSGEVNGVINALSDLGTDALTSFETNRDKNAITNKLVQKYALRQDAQTNLNTMVNNNINRTINQKNITDCVNNSTLSNIINLKRIVVDGPTATFSLTQKNILDAFYKCVVSSVTKSSDLQRISNDIINTSSQSAAQAAKASTTGGASSDTTDINKSTSLLDNLSSMIAVIVIIVVIFIVLIVLKFFFKSGNEPVIISQSEPRQLQFRNPGVGSSGNTNPWLSGNSTPSRSERVASVGPNIAGNLQQALGEPRTTGNPRRGIFRSNPANVHLAPPVSPEVAAAQQAVYRAQDPTNRSRPFLSRVFNTNPYRGSQSPNVNTAFSQNVQPSTNTGYLEVGGEN